MKNRMMLPRGIRWTALLVVFAAFGSIPARSLSPIAGPSTVRASGKYRDASIADYRDHLGQLISLVQACSRARDLKNCDPLLVGPDDRVPLSAGGQSGRRLIRYGWLRVLFSRAEEPDEAPATPDQANKRDASPGTTQPAPPSTSKLLLDAEKRLAGDLAQASTPLAAAPVHTGERATMAQVLAGRDFRDLEPSVRDTVLERVNNWLNHLLETVTRWRSRSAWVGRLLVWGFLLAVCIALVWALLQLRRRWRVRLAPERRAPETTAPSARNWQLWLEDARRAAAAGQWREAVHFVYWASISRLEARRLWPADRARTPREYLALLPLADPRHPALSTLTRNFERIWYGGRSAAETDYRRAEEMATSLIEGGHA